VILTVDGELKVEAAMACGRRNLIAVKSAEDFVEKLGLL
jgi:hypothetical protein